jgi:hypothetical protein
MPVCMAMQLVAQLSSLLSGWLSQGSISAGPPNAGLSRTPIHARKQTSETVRILNGQRSLADTAHTLHRNADGSGVSRIRIASSRSSSSARPVIGYFSARSPKTDVPMLSAFHRGLNEEGYVEGSSVGDRISVERRTT